jgi:hypothetical protein
MSICPINFLPRDLRMVCTSQTAFRDEKDGHS